jgi:hypothetical protein
MSVRLSLLSDDMKKTICTNKLKRESVGLAIHASVERICGDAQPALDPESVERFCQVWAEIGRAILLRRNQRK